MMQMFFFNFGFCFGFKTPFSFRNSPEINLYYSNCTHCPQEKSLLSSWGFRVLSHLIGHTLMMQIFSSISGFDSDTRAHFPSESVQSLFYFNKIEHFVFSGRVCYLQRDFEF